MVVSRQHLNVTWRPHRNLSRVHEIGSPGRARTYDLAVNSRSLRLLSYRGVLIGLLLYRSVKVQVNRDCWLDFGFFYC